ncbi:radical SAM protein [Clostridium sp. UBA1056]|uniref:radical SAM protein n=1 Tax=unclassified Clostridium TaxID=2614128 RepID=UPI003217E219
MKDLTILDNCNVCPRNCGIDRISGKVGFCKSGVTVKVAKAYGHMWEEPCVSGTKGSGTVFFSNCNLRCVFCQNHDISQSSIGKEISVERLSEIFLEQQAKGYHNINLVNPTHYVPQIIAALDMAKKSGLTIPVVYNSNGYENIESIKALNGYIDVYIPDLKYFNDKYAIKYSSAPNYFNIASKVIGEMVAQVGTPVFNEDDIMIKGVIIRHLMLPGLLFDSKKVVDYIYKTFGDSVYLSLMNQYTPMFKSTEYAEINRPLNPDHYDSLIDYCVDLGYKNAFIQESGTSSTVYVPDFNLQGI